MRKLKVFSVLLAFIFLLLPALTACKDPSESDSFLDQYEDTEEKTEFVKLVVDGFGTILIQLNADVAPVTVANFQNLVADGFYDGLTFHRVIEGFMIQGGDPKGDGTGGSDTKIKGEFGMNRVENGLKHVRGTISMARAGHPLEGYLAYYTYEQLGLTFEDFEPYYNSASSQFFIVHQTTSSLDGSYAAFGNVIYGMDVVDAIAAVGTNRDDKPIKTVTITSAGFMKKK